MTGAAMSLHKQSDVKNHLSSRFRTKIHLCRPVSDAASLSVDEPDTIKAVPLGFAEDFLAEHSSSDTAAAPAGFMTNFIRAQAAAISKNARA
jgi:hypothetical protein